MKAFWLWFCSVWALIIWASVLIVLGRYTPQDNQAGATIFLAFMLQGIFLLLHRVIEHRHWNIRITIDPR